MSDRLCPRCGKQLEPGAAECPDCAARHRPRRLGQQPLVLLGVVGVAAVLWTGAYFLTRAYRARQDQLAHEWYQRGETDLQAGRLPAAVSELRTALAYSRDNFTFRLRLAQALVAAQEWRQAEAQLRALWDDEPGNATVNLELARLAAARNDFQGAVRYYHSAVYGFWAQDPAQHRRETEIELVQFLLKHNATQQAQSELIALAADLPRDPALIVRVATLFQATGQYDRTLAEARNALTLDPHNPAALAVAGEAAFYLQHYEEARGYLQRTVAANPQATYSAGLLQSADLVLQMDPFARRLSVEERSWRLLRDVEQAQARLVDCAGKRGIVLLAPPPPSPLQSNYSQLSDFKRRLNPRELRRHPELADTAMDAVFRAENDAAQQCGAPSGPDHALLLIARLHEGAER